MHLDPRVADDWNFKYPNNEMDGEIRVCWEGKGMPDDIVFEGDPTPGMLPIDDEAKTITAKFNWTPTQGIDEESQRSGFFARLGDEMINQLTDLRAAQASQQQAHGVDKVLEAMAAMMEQQRQFMGLLMGKVTAAPVEDELTRQARELGETKVSVEEEPLEDIQPTEEELAEAAAAAYSKDLASNAKAKSHMIARKL